MTRPQHLYRVVIDSPATLPQDQCFRCGLENPEGDLQCWQCDLDLSPRTVGGKRRTFQSQAPASRRAEQINQHGGCAHVERSQPVVWP